MIKINKLEVYKKLLITSLLVNLGSLLNFIAIKSNGVYMPISRPDVNMFYLTDIFRIPFTIRFFSIGDFFIFLGIVYLFYQINKGDYYVVD